MVIPIQDYDFDKHFGNFSNSSLDPMNMTVVGSAPYVDVIGVAFYGVLFATIFIMLWLRQEDITIPLLLGFIIGGSLWIFMPQDWVAVAMSLTAVSFAGLMYYLLKGR
jgi:hypothetical protein